MSQALLRRPSHDLLPDYVKALRAGWSPNNLRLEAAQEQLKAIADNSQAFLDSLEDKEAKGAPVTLPDGSVVPRLPSIRRWICSGGFCGSIGLRWRPGSNDLPPTASGHIGYAVVPWRRNEGLATAALREMLPEARGVGLTAVNITTDPDNIASIRVIEKSGGTLLSRHARPPALGKGEELLFQIALGNAP